MDELPPEPARGTAVVSHTVTAEEVRQFAGVIGLRPPLTDRCSMSFLFQLYCSARGDPAKIVAEVRALEGFGRSSTRPAEEFDRPPLRGFWRKHYIVGGMSSFAKNVVLGLGKKSSELRRIIKEHYNPSTAHLPSEAISRNIAEAVTDVYQQRALAQNLTGEWIIFSHHEGQNYYLCLATHDEAQSAPNILAERIGGCVSEFPFLVAQRERATLAAN
jgi:hypothetical protein